MCESAFKYVFYVAGSLPHKYKVVIAGNHELTFDENCTHAFRRYPVGFSTASFTEAAQTHSVKDYLTNCIYLEDSEVTLYGLKIYGSPW
jgi:hypothetical protein